MDINSTYNSSLNAFCFSSGTHRSMALSALLFYILLTPLFGFILCVGCSKWKKQRSGSSNVNFSHFDAVTLNMVAVEAVNMTGVLSMLFAVHVRVSTYTALHDFLYLNASYMQSGFHGLVSIDRYVAVVHPVAYLRLKNNKAVANAAVAVVWLSSGGGAALVYFFAEPFKSVLGLLYNCLLLITVCYCSVSVLRALIRPAPGDGGGDGRRVDPSKRAAFDVLVTILGALLLRFIPLVVFYTDSISQLKKLDDCVMESLGVWCKVPSSLVVPLLFLRKEKSSVAAVFSRAKGQQR